MEIESNAFNSSLPSSIGNLPALEQLFARDSFIEGTIDTLVNMRNARKSHSYLFDQHQEPHPSLTTPSFHYQW
jgi:hypothetical protein